MPEGFLLDLPDGPACGRCGARTYVAGIDPHPRKTRRTLYRFECPRCFQLQALSVNRRETVAQHLTRLDVHIAKAQTLIDRQTTPIRRLAQRGFDTYRSRALLEVLIQSLLMSAASIATW